MNPDLEKKLYEKYPKIFRQKDLPMEETAMCWGCQCGDGWYDLIDKTCYLLQFHTDKNGLPQVEFNTVKEKHGTLCLYHNAINSFQEGIIDMAEYLSGFICEMCGQPGIERNNHGWISTLCDKCQKNQHSL